jgi:hypothetical protein
LVIWLFESVHMQIIDFDGATESDRMVGGGPKRSHNWPDVGAGRSDATNRCAIIALVRRAATGSSAVGRGPQALRQPRLHHTTPPITQHALDRAVDANARRLQPGSTTVPTATVTSIGKYAGKVARHCPTLVATPLPPRKPFQTG